MRKDIDVRLLLTYPVNRISQYEYYLQSIIDVIPPTPNNNNNNNNNSNNASSEYDDCVKALSVISQSSAIIQNNLIQSTETAKILSYQRRIKSEGMPSISLLKPGRKFLFEAKLKKYILILFNDVLVVTRLLTKIFAPKNSPQNELLSLIIILPLDKLQYTDIDARLYFLSQYCLNICFFCTFSNKPLKGHLRCGIRKITKTTEC